MYAFKTMSLLTLVVVGTESYMRTVIFLETHKQKKLYHRLAKDTASTACFGELIPAFVLQLMLQLLTILLTFFAAQIYPVSSCLAYINAAREETNKTAPQSKRLLKGVYTANPNLHSTQVDKKDFMPGFYAAQMEHDQTLLPLLESYEAQFAAKNWLVEDLKFLSPTMMMQSVLKDLAGMSFVCYNRFFLQRITFHHKWQDFFLPKLFKNQRLTPENYNHFSRFSFYYLKQTN